MFIHCLECILSIGNSQIRRIRAAILIGNWPVVKLCKARRLKVKSCPNLPAYGAYR
jgi:hypothetical protein